MYGRAGLDRFKKAQTLEPFSVSVKNPNPASTSSSHHAAASKPYHQHQHQHQHQDPQPPRSTSDAAPPAPSVNSQVTQVGAGQSSWQPPDWATEPCPGVFFLEVSKDGQVLDQVHLNKRRHVFGRQFQTCDFVLDHQSVSRQHAAVVPHKNGSVYVIDLGSAHGTFVANERLTKETPVELEVGQSVRFAASTRTYILRKNEAALFPSTPAPAEINLPPPPDPSDMEAVVAYNTLLNRYGISTVDPFKSTEAADTTRTDDCQPPEKAAKRRRKTRVAFRDQVGGELVEVVGISDGADVETEPGPLGLKEGSLVGKYESLVQITVIPKGKEQMSSKEGDVSQKGVTDKLQEVLNRVRNTSSSKSSIYNDLYGESSSVKVGSSWANASSNPGCEDSSPVISGRARVTILSSSDSGNNNAHVDDDDDLFGD